MSLSDPKSSSETLSSLCRLAGSQSPITAHRSKNLWRHLITQNKKRTDSQHEQKMIFGIVALNCWIRSRLKLLFSGNDESLHDCGIKRMVAGEVKKPSTLL